jgi:complex III assembly factor LYRM7
MLDAARQQIRQGFREKASLSPSDPTVQPAIQHAEEVASFLKTNLVQGRREGDKYSECASSFLCWLDMLLTALDLELRIHQYTERGDNDSIKLGNKNITVDGGVKCCSER